MRLAVTYSRTTDGIHAPLVTVEAHIAPGLPGFAIVGLPETAIKESRERIRSAIINSGFEFPAKKIIINLAPADLPKEGSKFDLPIALSILAASSQIPKNDLINYEFSGELALTGELRAINKALLVAIAVQKSNRTLILPQSNAINYLPLNAVIYLANSLQAVCNFLTKKSELNIYAAPLQLNNMRCNQNGEYEINNNSKNNNNYLNSSIDFGDIYGQRHAKRALLIAAAGKHNVLMVGPPGTGKTMLASRITTILPDLKYEELLEVAAIHSIKYPLEDCNLEFKQFRSPHHTASVTAIVGGGGIPKPGEVSLAHLGVLFLDELPEFNKKVIEALREPLENKTITVTRARNSLEFPANFQLIAAMNPCPCGYYKSQIKDCNCSSTIINRYLSKISGPILDRIDIKIFMPNIATEDLLRADKTVDLEFSSKALRDITVRMRELQFKRANRLNAELQNEEIKKYCSLNLECQTLLTKVIDKFKLSPRSCNRTIKVARTIADLEHCENIEPKHLAEAVGYSATSLI